jgi:hypothetical protein
VIRYFGIEKESNGPIIGSLEAAAARSMSSYNDLNRSLISPRAPVTPREPVDARRPGPRGDRTVVQQKNEDDRRQWLLHLHEGSTSLEEQVAHRHRQEAIDHLMNTFLAKDEQYRKARAEATEGQYVQYDLNLSRVSCATPPLATLDSAFQYLATDPLPEDVVTSAAAPHDFDHDDMNEGDDDTIAASLNIGGAAHSLSRLRLELAARRRRQYAARSRRHVPAGMSSDINGVAPIFITEAPSSSSLGVVGSSSSTRLLHGSNSNKSGIMMVPPRGPTSSVSSSRTDLTSIYGSYNDSDITDDDTAMELYVAHQHEVSRAEEKLDDREFDRLRRWGRRAHRTTIEGVGSMRGMESDQTMMNDTGNGVHPDGWSLVNGATSMSSFPNGSTGKLHASGSGVGKNHPQLGRQNSRKHMDTTSFKAMPGIFPRQEADQLSNFINQSGVGVSYKDVLGALVAPPLRTSVADQQLSAADRRSLFADTGIRLVYDPLPHIKPAPEADIILAIAQDEVKKAPTPPPYFAREMEELEYERLMKFRGPPWMFRPVRRLLGDDKLNMFEQDWKEMMLPDVVTSHASRYDLTQIHFIIDFC